MKLHVKYNKKMKLSDYLDVTDMEEPLKYFDKIMKLKCNVVDLNNSLLKFEGKLISNFVFC